MPKFKVQLQCYVEEIATVEVEAEDKGQAIALAMAKGGEADWKPGGGDVRFLEATAVHEIDGTVIWERC